MANMLVRTKGDKEDKPGKFEQLKKKMKTRPNLASMGRRREASTKKKKRPPASVNMPSTSSKTGRSPRGFCKHHRRRGAVGGVTEAGKRNGAVPLLLFWAVAVLAGCGGASAVNVDGRPCADCEEEGDEVNSNNNYGSNATATTPIAEVATAQQGAKSAQNITC